MQQVHGRRQLGPVQFVETARAQARLVNLSERGKQPHHQLQGGHFHAEYRHRYLVLDRRVFRDVHRQRRLAHGGASGDNDQIGILQACGQFVEILEAAGRAGNFTFEFVKFLDLFDRFLDGFLHGNEIRAGPYPLVGDRKDPAFRLFQQLAAVTAV